MRDFATKFEYLCAVDAENSFMSLLSSSFLSHATQTALQNNYEIWKNNVGQTFWASRTATLSLTQTASGLVAEGAHVAQNLVYKKLDIYCFTRNISKSRYATTETAQPGIIYTCQSTYGCFIS